MWTKKQAPAAMAASSVLGELEETDDGWVVISEVTATATKPRGKPPRPLPPRRPVAIAASADQTFDPAPDEIVGRYLPLRRTLRCDGLPRQIHDADVYGAHPGFLAAVYPAANDRHEWFFFACRGGCHGGRRRAGPGAYCLAGEAKLLGGNAYCHTFWYYEDTAAQVGSASERATEWRMDEYGACGSARAGAAAAFHMVVCKVYPARGRAIQGKHDGGHVVASPARPRADPEANMPQVLVQLYLASLNLGDPLRCRMHPATDVCAAHPAVLTAVLPAANDRCEWFFAVRRARAYEDEARPRRAGPGAYVPVRDCRVADGKRGDVGYRRVFWYREDDATVRRVSLTEWWMQEYGFGRDFPYSKMPTPTVHGCDDEELVLYKVYVRMAGDRG